MKLLENRRKVRGITLFAAAALLALCSSCGQNSFGGRPKGRFGCLPSGFGANFPDPADLGIHGKSEKNGLVYTCRGGPIDLAHLRKAADWTRYLAGVAYDNIMADREHFEFKLVAPSRYHVSLTYPQGWQALPAAEKEKTAREIAVELGQYYSFVGTTWHEIITWYGYKSAAFIPEDQSAFTWEDQFSNFLGTYVAGRALSDPGADFNEAVTAVLKEELELLEVRSSKTARIAAEEISLRHKYFDTGLSGRITPMLIENIAECESREARSYVVPGPDEALSGRGFSMSVEIEPRIMEAGRILEAVFPRGGGKRIDPESHFEPIMERIKRQAEEKWPDRHSK
jgi:hypothetical protein